jgi:hypothetical protein
MISLGRPLRGIGLRGIESGFDRVEGALPPCVSALQLEISLPASVTGPVCGWSFPIRAGVWRMRGAGEGAIRT